MIKEPEILDDYLEGYRAWRVVGNRLYSLLKDGEYPRGVAMAKCNSTRHYKNQEEEHDAPDKKCTCGLYANWNNNESITSELIGIAGKVKGWGKSYLASGGWRSQYQMIEYLYNPLCQVCCALYRYDELETDKLNQATRKLKFNVSFRFNTSDTLEYSTIDLNEFLCKTHLDNILNKDELLITKMLLNPASKLDITIEDIDVKKAITDTKYMKDLKDLSNYYEVDFKEFNNENS